MSDPAPKRPSVLVLVLEFVAIFVVAIVAALLGAPPAGVSIASSMVAVALFVSFSNRRRQAGATARDPVSTASFPLQLPVERVDPDKVKAKFADPLWAPGLLCVGADFVRFIPSKDRHAGRAWESSARRIEVRTAMGVSTYVLVEGDGSRARFVVLNARADDVASRISPYVTTIRT